MIYSKSTPQLSKPPFSLHKRINMSRNCQHTIRGVTVNCTKNGADYKRQTQKLKSKQFLSRDILVCFKCKRKGANKYILLK